MTKKTPPLREFAPLSNFGENPASGDYMMGSPLFHRVSLKLANGKTFTVMASGNSPENVSVSAYCTPIPGWTE